MEGAGLHQVFEVRCLCNVVLLSRTTAASEAAGHSEKTTPATFDAPHVHPSPSHQCAQAGDEIFDGVVVDLNGGNFRARIFITYTHSAEPTQFLL